MNRSLGDSIHWLIGRKGRRLLVSSETRPLVPDLATCRGALPPWFPVAMPSGRPWRTGSKPSSSQGFLAIKAAWNQGASVDMIPGPSRSIDATVPWDIDDLGSRASRHRVGLRPGPPCRLGSQPTRRNRSPVPWRPRSTWSPGFSLYRRQGACATKPLSGPWRVQRIEIKSSWRTGSCFCLGGEVGLRRRDQADLGRRGSEGPWYRVACGTLRTGPIASLANRTPWQLGRLDPGRSAVGIDRAPGTRRPVSTGRSNGGERQAVGSAWSQGLKAPGQRFALVPIQRFIQASKIHRQWASS